MGCIYQITNKINNKKYIGKTEGIPFERWRQHVYDASNDTGFAIAKAIHKYGIENFIFEVIESNIDANQLNAKEQYYIKLYDTFNYGYNLTLGGDGCTQYSHSQIKDYFLLNKNIEQTAKHFQCSTATVRRVLKEYNIYTNYNNYDSAMSVEQYDLIKDILLNTYPSLSAAGKALNKTSIAPIKDACNKKTSQAYGYRWKYVNDTTKLPVAVSGFTKKVLQIDKNNKIIHTFSSVKEASNSLKLDASSISKVCRGERKTCGGFKWAYLEEDN